MERKRALRLCDTLETHVAKSEGRVMTNAKGCHVLYRAKVLVPRAGDHSAADKAIQYDAFTVSSGTAVDANGPEIRGECFERSRIDICASGRYVRT